MFKSSVSAIRYALQNIRTNFFHTLLSVLGIVIGVSALIVILSMIDGLEKYAQDQISTTTSVKVVEMSSVTVETIDGIRIRKQQPAILTADIHNLLLDSLPVPVTTYRVSEVAKEITVNNETAGSVVYYADPDHPYNLTVDYGTHFFDADSALTNSRVAVIDTMLANRFTGGSFQPDEVIGRVFRMDDQEFEVTGITAGYAPGPEMFVSLAHLAGERLWDNPPFIAFQAENIADVPVIKESLEEWLETSEFTEDDFRILSQDFRVNQALQGFQLFRIIMGLIVGLSVLVGGIGVMNVLLISVTQRTKEIGVRKAVGSRKKDIYVQFLSESIVISLFGTVVGIVIGILVALAVVPIVHQIIEAQFRPAFSFLTIGLITLFSLLIGILFGTFPAYKASQLEPIDALRRE
ncbi:MAG: FtsX-like permease family protein [Balneolaceae bacterium]|nr:FtsX-like permease family protein [Balneolaceae bacterium]